VAIVGTRKPTARARRFAYRLAADLCRAGVAVLSGGALGIDSAAHLGALRARGSTAVIAPAGYRVPYPTKNARLFRRILERQGAYLSVVGDMVVAEYANFFARNACLAALSHAVVVVEAPYRSGARNAARWARSLGRPLLAAPSAPWNKRGRGSLLELRRGASLCVTVEDVLRELERTLLLPAQSLNVPRPKPASAQVELPFPPTAPDSRELAAVLRAVGAGATHLDAVCELSGLPASAAQRHILTLTLGGVLAPDPAGGVRLIPAAKPVSPRKRR
jgi:DNA processing protein